MSHFQLFSYLLFNVSSKMPAYLYQLSVYPLDYSCLSGVSAAEIGGLMSFMGIPHSKNKNWKRNITQVPAY